MTRSFLFRTSLLAVALLAALPLSVYAGGSTISLKVYFYNQVVDEQNTTLYYNNGTQFCSGSPFVIHPAEGFPQLPFRGDSLRVGLSNAYNFGGPWTYSPLDPSYTLSSTLYVDKEDCSTTNNCLRVQFNSNSKILSLDTRGTFFAPTGKSRTLEVDFKTPYGPSPVERAWFHGSTVVTPALLDVFLDIPYTSMGICSTASTTCPEADQVFAKLWFTDSKDPSVTWRVDWLNLRVLRMSNRVWYFIGDACDGTQVAGLSKLTGSRTRPKTIFNGNYLIPLFIAAELNP